MAEVKKDEEGKTIPASAPLPPEKKETEGEETPKTVKVGEKEYESPEALAEAYQSLETKLGTQGNELGTERAAKNTALQEIETLKTAAAESKAEEGGPESDYEAQLAEIYKDLDAGDITVEAAMKQSNALTAEVAAQKGAEKATEGFETTLRERDSKEIEAQFLKDHPDFEELRASGALEPIKGESPMHDDFSAYFALKATTAKEEGKTEAAKLAAGDEGTQTVLTKPGETIQQKNVPITPLSDTEAQDSMLAAVNKAPA
jgi:hypothetical protein